MIRVLLLVIGRRLLAIVPVFFIVSMLVFGLLRLLPVDPAQMSLPATATVEQIEQKRIDMGLHLPIWKQYQIWVGQTLEGDLGMSTMFRADAAAVISARIPATVELAVCALIFAVVVGVGGGLFLFVFRGTPLETTGLVGTSMIMALPDFLLALLMILVLGVLFPIFPVNGRIEAGIPVPDDGGFLLFNSIITGNGEVFASVLSHIAMPTIALGLAFTPMIIRVLHSSLIATYQESFIEQTRLRGMSETAILFRHGLKNAIVPVVVLVGTQFGALFGGTLLVEMIFSYPGLGSLMLRAMQSADLTVIQTVSLIYCGTTLVFNSLADAGAYMLNPRLRA